MAKVPLFIKTTKVILFLFLMYLIFYTFLNLRYLIHQAPLSASYPKVYHYEWPRSMEHKQSHHYECPPSHCPCMIASTAPTPVRQAKIRSRAEGRPPRWR